MIEIPIGKALVAIDANGNLSCKDCDLNNMCMCKQKMKIIGFAGTRARYSQCNRILLNCMASERKDGKPVIYKLVDWPGENKTND
jgi:hypothetical protein